MPVSCCLKSEPLDFGADVVLGFTKAFLQAPEKFLLLAFSKDEIVVGQLPILLLQLAFDFVPVAFEVERSHTSESPSAGPTDVPPGGSA